MIHAFLIPGFNPERTFNDPAFDILRETMKLSGVHLDGVSQPWGEYGINEYGRLACDEMQEITDVDILIGHSVGAIAALAAAEQAPVRHLILCSPSALFAEDSVNLNGDTIDEFIGQGRKKELSEFSSKEAVRMINMLALPTTVTFGSLEEEVNPRLTARAQQLARDITTSELVVINGAEHSIRHGIYAHELARLTSNM